MKKLLLIFLGAFAVFMVLAIAEEWEFFAAAWFGAEEPPATLSESERKAAADTVYLALSLMQHFYATGGDSRFAERMPVGPAVIEEMRADVEYLRRNRRRQEPSLERLEVSSVEPLGPGRVEIETREWWQIEILSLAGGAPTEPATIQSLFGKYLVVRQDRGWRVEAWDFLEPEAAADGGEEP